MKNRILEVCKERGLTHIGSCFSMADVLEEIYKVKKPEDLVILDAGHAHIAHLVAREKYEGKEFPEVIEDIHCNERDGCDVATGSLGLGITIAIGRALAKKRDVYCVLSDGGCAEGSVWEALRIKADNNINNLKIYVNANGWSALDRVDLDKLESRLKAFDPSIRFVRTNSDFEYQQSKGYSGLDTHYVKL